MLGNIFFITFSSILVTFFFAAPAWWVFCRLVTLSTRGNRLAATWKLFCNTSHLIYWAVFALYVFIYVYEY